MSAADYLLTEEQLLCCICLDVFSDPVTVPCGHNFCKKCITQHLNSNSQRLCPMCKERVDRKCKFGVNTFISEMSLKYRQSAGRKDGKISEQQVAEPGEVSCDVPTGTNLLPSYWTVLKFCLFLVFGLLCLTVTLKLHKMVPSLKSRQLFDVFENAEGSGCPKHGKPLELNCKKEQMPICQSCSDSSHRFHDIVPLKEEYEAKIKELQETKAVIQQKIQELLRLLQNTVDVTLDPETVHPHLIVSDDEKQVHQSGVLNKVSDNLKQFDRVDCVLGKPSFSMGRFYYDVQVKGKTAWILGVTKESANRKGVVRRNPENGMWALMHIHGDYLPLTSQPEHLSVKDPPEKVRVFVDYEDGLVSFYNVDSASIIYSFTGCSFTGRIHPIFCPIDSVPLILTPAAS